MIDIHSHILPMTDDGAYNFDEALQMADMAAQSGVRILVATPHSNQVDMYENYYDDLLKQRFEELRNAIKAERIPLEVRLGMEIMSSPDVDRLLLEGKLIGLNKSRNCLVEFWFDEYPEEMEEQLRLILAAGRVPVIAHPERYDCVQDNPMIIKNFLDMGCRTQVNKGSVLGRFGRQIEETAWFLLQERMVTCIGSDAHKPYRRTTEMSEIRRCISRYFSPDYAHELLVKNPARVIGGRERIVKRSVLR